MPITQLLKDTHFTPDLTRVVKVAFEMTCTALKFPRNDNPVVTRAAKRIVNLIRVSIEERKHELARLLTQEPRAGGQLCEHIDQPGDVVFAHACQLGCEGIVSKRLGSRYRPGPRKSSDWIKVKNPTAPAVTRASPERPFQNAQSITLLGS
jgi:hypothetical protein